MPYRLSDYILVPCRTVPGTGLRDIVGRLTQAWQFLVFACMSQKASRESKIVSGTGSTREILSESLSASLIE